MAVRFRIRTSAGQELSFASHDTFEVFVRDGDLSPDDLIYDGETGSWSPARTHPIVLEIEYERGDEGEPDTLPGSESEAGPSADGSSDGSREPEDPSSAAAVPGDSETEAPKVADGAFAGGEPAAPPPGERSLGDHPVSHASAGEAETDVSGTMAPVERSDSIGESGVLDEGSATWESLAPEGMPGPEDIRQADTLSGLDLTPADPQAPDEETRAFVERMEAEREADFGRGVSGVPRGGASGDILGQAAPLGDLPSTPLGGVVEAAEERRPAVRDRPRRWERVESSPPWRATVEDRSVESEPQTSTRASRGARVMGLATVILLLGGTGGYAGFRLVNAEQPTPPATSPSEPVRPMEVVPEPPAAEPDPVIPSTPTALREEARERFLTVTRAELGELDEIPTVWATGAYIVLPSEYPEVVDVWQSYVDTIDRVRAGDLTRYRRAFVAALDAAGVEGSDRVERLATGMREFTARTARREAHYRRVIELANAALRAHNELIEAEGLILFDGTAPTVESGRIGAGLSGRNAESQRLLEEVVELLEQRLSSGGEGPGTGSDVRAWVWDGLLAAMTTS